MLRHRSIKHRPENPGRRVPLQHINVADARRDARIAASKAFVLSRERSSSETPEMFPDPYPMPPPAALIDTTTPRHRQLPSRQLQSRRSIRFVRQTSPSNEDGPPHLSNADDCSYAPSPSLYPDSKSCLSLTLHEAHHPSAPLATPTSHRYHSINKTWNGAMLHNKENIQENEAATSNSKFTDTTDGVFTYPASGVVGAGISGAKLSSQSFLRTHRRASFSFSSNDDDQLVQYGQPGGGSAALNISVARMRRQSDVHMRKSLRQSRSSLGISRPLTPNPKLPLKAMASTQDKTTSNSRLIENTAVSGSTGKGQGTSLNTNVDTGFGTAGSGMDSGMDPRGLRRTASKMSKMVKSKLRILWSHSKSEAYAGELPEQHIQARKSHGSLPGGPRFCSGGDGGRRYSASDLCTSLDNNDTGTVVVCGEQNGTRPGSQFGGDTSRFTSWSSSVQRTCSNTSHRVSMNDCERQQLPAISEGGDQLLQQQKQASHGGDGLGLLASGLAKTPQQRHQSDMPDIKAVPAFSPSTSSPSLAGSGRGSTPRPTIAPEALQRLQELSLNLQRVCYDDNMDKYGARQTFAGDDPFFDGPKKEVLYAFQSTATTPAKTTETANMAELSPAPSKLSEPEPGSPQFFFRGKSPFRRALHESMNSFEEQTAARRTKVRIRDRVPAGDGLREDEDDADEPLLHPNGVRQWSRVQAWQESLVHKNNSSSSVSNYSQRSPAGAMAVATQGRREMPGLQTMIAEALGARGSEASLCGDEERAFISRPQRLEQLHSETAVSPEQVRLWTSPMQGSELCSSPWGPRRHTRERAELGCDDLEDRF